MTVRRHTLKHDLVIHLVLGFLAVVTFFPFVFLLISSFRPTVDFMHTFWGLPTVPEWANYRDAWTVISPYMLNSLIVSGVSMVGVLAIASVSAFVFARFRFPGRELLFMAVLALLMIPSILTLIPAFLLVKDLNLINTYWALILPYIAGGQVFAIFILRSFIASLPEELFEASRLDGASTFQMFKHIALPLSKPMLITVAIMNVLSTWNDYIWPLVTIPQPETLDHFPGHRQLRQPVRRVGTVGTDVRRLCHRLDPPDHPLHAHDALLHRRPDLRGHQGLSFRGRRLSPPPTPQAPTVWQLPD